MKLFLCSETITQETQKDFEHLIGRTTSALKIAYIYTATLGYKAQIEAKGEKWDLSWLDKELSEYEETFKFKFQKYDINEMNIEQLQAMYDENDGVWVSGGITSYLLDAIYKTKADNILKRFANEKFYISTSAGGMICSKEQDASEWFIIEPEESPIQYEGLGLIPFQFYPHYSEIDLKAILKARHPDQEYWLVKDGQAIAYDGNSFKVCGGDITILKPISSN
jgi:peptidase E